MNGSSGDEGNEGPAPPLRRRAFSRHDSNIRSAAMQRDQTFLNEIDNLVDLSHGV
jgi:hypothetical protein